MEHATTSKGMLIALSSGWTALARLADSAHRFVVYASLRELEAAAMEQQIYASLGDIVKGTKKRIREMQTRGAALANR